MSYPDYPNNRLVVNGVDLSETYQLILVDGYTLSPPSPKTYIVDIPGGNGKLDLTETLLGDTAYDNRKQEFSFYVIDAENFEDTKTQVSNFLHGKAYSYTMTMDPDYIYHGRFTVSSYEHSPSSMGIIGVIKVSIDSDPFKFKTQRMLAIDAVGGKITYVNSGRKRVRPTIETSSTLKVIYNGKLVRLPIGTWVIDDLFFEYGDNYLYCNSYDFRTITWGELVTRGVTWGEFKTRRLFEWYKINGDYMLVDNTWSNIEGTTWDELSSTTWREITHTPSIPDHIDDVIIKYDWGDL